MKRAALIALVLAVGVCPGLVPANSQTAGARFPYLPEELNQVPTATELQWRCASASFDLQSYKPAKGPELLALNVIPKPDRLVIKANLAGKKGAAVFATETDKSLRESAAAINKHVSSRVGLPATQGIKDREVLLYADSKPVACVSETGVFRAQEDTPIPPWDEMPDAVPGSDPASLGNKAAFSYAPAELSRPCDRTEFEWRCLKARFDVRPAKPVSAYDRVEMLSFKATPRPKSLLVEVNVGWCQGHPIKSFDYKRTWSDFIDRILPAYLTKVTGAPKDADFVHTEVRVLLEGRPFAVRTSEGIKYAK